MSWPKKPTYDIMQDVQYANDIEITSVVFDGTRFYRAYSVFDAFVSELDARIRSQLIAKIGTAAERSGCAVRMQRYKSGYAWFISMSGFIAAGADIQSKLKSGDGRYARFKSQFERDFTALERVVEQVSILENQAAEHTRWPVRRAD